MRGRRKSSRSVRDRLRGPKDRQFYLWFSTKVCGVSHRNSVYAKVPEFVFSLRRLRRLQGSVVVTYTDSGNTSGQGRH